MTNQPTRRPRTQLLSVALAVVVALSVAPGFAGAATTTDLTVSITDGDNTVAPGETTTVEIAVASADGGVGAAEFGVELGDPGVATITDVAVENDPGSTDNAIVGGGQSADVRYAFADSPDTGAVSIVTVTLQGAAPGTTDVNLVPNSATGNLAVYDEGGEGYTIGSAGSATLTVEEPNQPPSADAGADQTVDAGAQVSLDGSDSSDPNSEDTLTYEWTQTAGPTVSLSDVTAAQPTFTAPGVTTETTLTFELSVTDDGGETDSDLVNVTVEPLAAAAFEVSNLQAPDSATQGDTIDVSADIENTGEQPATKDVEFRVDTDGDGSIGDENAVATQSVQLDAGGSTTVSFDDVDTSRLQTGTLTHGVATPDDVATAQMTIEAPPADETAVSLEPATQTAKVGATATYEVVVEAADGGVGAGELRVAVDDAGVAELVDVHAVSPNATQEIEVANDGSWVELDYAFADTADTGSVAVAEVTVEGAAPGSAALSIEPTDDNAEVLLFDENGDGYDVTGTNGATVNVQATQFQVSDLSAPDRVAVGDSLTITADVTSDGAVQSTQSVELLLDVDGDGTAESVATEQVTLDAGATQTVSFDVSVPADAAFGERGYTVETAADSASGQVEFAPPDVDGDGTLPIDPDGDGLYEDVNGDGSVNVGDAQSLFSNRESAPVQNHVDAYDFNGDGVVNVGDAQSLFDEVTN